MKTRNPSQNEISAIQKMTIIAMLSALSLALAVLKFPLTLIAPPFYELDFSEVAVLIGAFALGPVAGVIIELIKNLLVLIIIPSPAGWVGVLANFLIGCSFTLPAALIYRHRKTKKLAVVGMGAGTASLCFIGALINGFFLIPLYSEIFGWPIAQIVALGAESIPLVSDLLTFCLLCVVPFNLIKGILVSVITFFLYKPLSIVIHRRY